MSVNLNWIDCNPKDVELVWQEEEFSEMQFKEIQQSQGISAV